MRSNTATGRPLEVMTKSSLPADLSHCFAGFFCKSLTEIVLMLKGYAAISPHASRADSNNSVWQGVGCSVEFISLVERGVNVPSVAGLEKFAKILKVEVWELFTFEEKKKR